MKVLLVNGAPHEKGCTYTALCEIEKALNAAGVDTEIFWLGNKPVRGCIGCGGCAKNDGKCVFNDDIANTLIDKAAEADGFIFGSPVHYASISGNLAGFMDRLFYSSPKSLFRLKPAAAVLSARRAGTTASFDQLNKYFSISEMPIISSRYWNMVHGSTAEDVTKDAEGLWTMRVLAENMAYHLKCKEAAAKAGIQLPEQETPVFTNFVR